MNDKQLIYSRLIDCLNSVAFINELEELKDATPERLKEFVEVKRQVREELQDLVAGKKPKAKKPFSTAKYKTHDGKKGSPEQWREAAKVVLNVNGENCLSTLGLTGVPATEAELKKVYRDAIRKAHPDVGGSEDEAARLNAAYELALNLFFTKPQEPKGKRKDTGLRSQLLTPIEESEVIKYIEDDLWCAQEKMDGKHGIIKKEGSTILAANKQGLEMAIPRSVEEAVQSLSYDITFDGELINGRFYVFDILQDQTTDCRTLSYKARYERLRKIFPDYQLGSLHLVPMVFSTSAKAAMFSKLKAEDREGIVFKRMDTSWSEGRPEVGGNMVKCKFWASLSAIVSEEETGKSSFASYVLDATTGERVDLGRCSALGKVAPKVGDVVEIKYLYAYKGGKLIQQSLLGIRDDVSPNECTTKQLKYKAEN